MKAANIQLKLILIITSFIFLSFLLQIIFQQPVAAVMKKVRIAVFPFNDIQSESLDMNIPALLRAELIRHDFIEIVPVKTIRRRLYEIEPSLLWTVERGNKKSSGIIWSLEPRIVEKVNRKVFADLSIYGDITRFGIKWKVISYILKQSVFTPSPEKSFTATGYSDDEIPDKIVKMADEIINWLKSKKVLNEAEEDIRRYMGNIYTYSIVLEKMKKHVSSFPNSIPLNAHILNLYLKEKEKYQGEIINVGSKIISLYDPSREEDTRYMLSLDIDPFEVTAKVYEERRDWENAINIRNNALKMFPYKIADHTIVLGRDHYFLAISLEKKGQKERALDNYKKAITFLPPYSKDFKQAKKKFDSLKK